MKKVSIITLGCAKNQNDTENLGGLLKKEGFALTNNPEQADTIVVHTCSFIDAAKKESVQTILEAAHVKGSKKQLIVSGCMVQQHGKEMMQELPEVDAFLGTGQLGQIPNLIRNPKPRFLDRQNPGGFTDPDADRLLSSKGPTANLRLSEGCSHPCSFCVIPKLRGGLQSRPEDVILKEAQHLVSQGVEELVIIGQDTGDWGREKYGERKLSSLLRKLRDVKGVRWIRLMYMHPYSFTEDLLNVFKESPEFFPYLDMPLQHIDDQMLTEMNRRLGEVELRKLIDSLHTKLPKLSLRTTFIVGYPGETEKQFNRLHQFVKDGHFDYMGAFTYSQEESTPAALKENQLPEDIKTSRHAALIETQFQVTHKKAQKRIGTTETILIEEEEGEDLIGRSSREAPEIDAIFRLPKKAARYGRFIEATIDGYDSYEFSATPLNSK